MILAGNQPYFLPYLGYWQLIAAADLFLLGDDYCYIRRGWVNRNRILVDGAPRYFRVEVRKNPVSRLICDKVRVMDPKLDRNRLRTLEMTYHRAPCFDAGYALAERIFACPDPGLLPFLEYSIREVCQYLEITTPVGRMSELEGNAAFRREERIYDACRRLGADTYINAVGGQTIYRFPEFARRGIRLRFLRSGLPPYPQFGRPFVPSLSILDAIMFNPPERLQEMLRDYTWIDG